MKILDNEFGNREDFGIASFTIDPITDTPKKLKECSERLEIKSKNECKILEVNFFRMEPNFWSHSSLIVRSNVGSLSFGA